MWLLGALIGLLIMASIKLDLALLGLIAGGFIGHQLSQKKKAAEAPDIQLRVSRLESELAALRSEVEALRNNEQPLSVQTSGTTSPITNAPTEPPAALDEAAGKPAEISPAASPEPQFEALPATTYSIELPEWIKKLWAGNPLAKIGIVLLFFGVASGLKLAAESGLIPVSLRLFIAAAAGIALIVFGVNKVRNQEQPQHRTFGLAIQGGGFALLYLVGYFMLERYAMIHQGLAFGLFAVLGVTCVFMAARQDGPALAVLGLSGAFLAPVLAGGRADSPLGLFSYFALLNLFILGVDWFKSWRVLNITGFIFTFAVGMAWAVDGYQDRHYLVTQIFLIIFLIAYTAMPVATSLLRAPGLAGWREGMLLFGPPLIGTFLQMQLMQGVEYGLAWSALAGSLWYFSLWALLVRRGEPESILVERSHLGLAIALLTISVPLAFGAQVTSAFWAAEGTAVLWFGIRTRRLLAQGTGLAMQFAAGIALLLGWHQLGHQLPVLNNAVFGAFILSTAGLISARLLRSMETDRKAAPVIPFIWAVCWWLCTGFGEIEHFALPDLHAPYGLLLVAATVGLLESVARRWQWPQIRAAAVMLLAGLWIAALMTIERSGHPFSGLMALALPVALGAHYALLATHEKSGAFHFMPARHLGAWWLMLVILPLELSWQLRQLAPGVDLWPFMVWVASMAGGIALATFGNQRFWPFTLQQARYIPIGIAPPAIALILLLITGNLHLDGGTGGLAIPYLPLLNFFDITVLSGLGAILLLTRVIDRVWHLRIRGTVAAITFLWISTLAARIAHHWGDVPFDLYSLNHAMLFQALLTLFWTMIAIGTMIAASRQNQRPIWFGGFGLLGIVGAKLLLFDATGRGTLTWTGTLIGVALLVLAASYFAPLPPKINEKQDEDSAQ